MGKALVVVAIWSGLGCVHAPKNKPRAYITGGAAIVIGGATIYAMNRRSCDSGSSTDDISCSVGGDVISLLGLTLVVAGAATIAITALAPDAEP